MLRRALVVDDDTFGAAMVRGVLTNAGFKVELAHTAEDAVEAFQDFDPDIAILDISLGQGPSGVDLAHIAHRSNPATALLLLTRYPDLRTAQLTASELPPDCGFLSKDRVNDPAALLDAVEAVLRSAGESTTQAERGSGPLSALTRTQLAVLRMVVQGFTNSEIARRRGCTTNALEKVLTSIYERLGIDKDSAVHPRVEAIRIWVASSALPERVD